MKLSKEHQSKGKSLLQDLITRSWEDSDFKSRLINRPEETIKSLEREDVSIPKEFVVVVEDQTDLSKIYLNIPKKMSLDNIELSDEQLEAVSGGILALSAAAIVGLGILFVGSVGLGITIYNQATNDD